MLWQESTSISTSILKSSQTLHSWLENKYIGRAAMASALKSPQIVTALLMYLPQIGITENKWKIPIYHKFNSNKSHQLLFSMNLFGAKRQTYSSFIMFFFTLSKANKT